MVHCVFAYISKDTSVMVKLSASRILLTIFSFPLLGVALHFPPKTKYFGGENLGVTDESFARSVVWVQSGSGEAECTIPGVCPNYGSV
jgi:hypothetical protein